MSLFSLQVLAQSGCDDLSGVAETPAVDYETQIQTIFTSTCIGCHNQFHSTGLDLRSGESYALLVDVPSTQDGSWLRVAPSALEDSLLFHKINCNTPPVGNRMPLGGSPLTPQQQALFRDWINQGALAGPVETYSIGGAVTGLDGSGLVLQNNGGDDRAISANGSFTFATELEDGESYNVTVLSQPGSPSQACTVTNGSGTVSGADVTDVEIDCVTNSFTVGGMVSGLEGSGLVLQNNGGDDLAISADGSFTFDTPVDDGNDYNVTVSVQPGSPQQTCTVSNGGGTVSGANVTDVMVNCATDTFTVGGTISGLEGSGLVLQNNGGDDLAISADGPFAFATELSQGQAYEVTVSVQPGDPQLFCMVENGAGVMPAANVDDVGVECFEQDPEVFRDRFEAQ